MSGDGERPGRVAYVNARLIDPESGLDAPGALLTEGRRIVDLGPRLVPPQDAEVIDCGGHCLAPGLVDMRAHLREPGAEHKETLATASRAAAAGGVMNDGELATRLGLTGMPGEAEVIIIDRDLRLVERSGTPYHVAHLSTAAAVDAVRAAKARGLPVTCATAPHYFTLDETACDDYRTFAKVRPPLRSAADRAAICAGLADGTIDAIVSDHAPHDQDSKRTTFAQAAFGIIGLETMLPLALALVHDGHLSLPELLRRLGATPARLLGLEQGRLAKGAPADLVLFDLDTPWSIDVSALRSKSLNAPYDGRPVRGRALRTVVGGRTVFDAAREA